MRKLTTTMEDILKNLKVEPANRWAQARMRSQKIAKNKTLVIKLYEEDDNWKRDIYEASGSSPDSYGARGVWTRQMDNRILVVTVTQIGSMIYKEYIEHGYIDVRSTLKVTY